MRQLPDRLYKYGSIRIPEYLRQILLEDTLYCTNPFDFNDPFDCRPRIIIGQSQTELARAEAEIFKILRFNFPKVDKAKLRQYAKESIQKLLGEQDGFSDQYESLIKRAGVCCFSETCTNILMWSHYADKHTGYCLEFSTQLPESFFPEMVRHVHYQENYPVVRLFASDQDPDELGKLAFLTKAPDWKYEKEWRVTSKEPGTVPFSPALLTGIILGCKMNADHEKQILSWITKRSFPIVVKKAIMNNKEFKLDIVALQVEPKS